MSGLRIGVLGASRIAELAVISPAAGVTGSVAVAARDRGRAETFARTYRVERVDSYADLVADPRWTSSTTRWPTRFMHPETWPPSRPVLKYITAAKEAGCGVVFITHNPHHAHMVGDHFVLLTAAAETGLHLRRDRPGTPHPGNGRRRRTRGALTRITR